MIFTLAFCLGVLVAAAPAAQPIGSDEKSQDLDIMKMAQVNETLVVVKRKHSNEMKVRCQSAKKTKRDNETQYHYTLRAQFGGRNRPVYREQNVTVTLLPLGERSGYKSTYTDHENTTFTLTLKKTDLKGGCFVVYVEKSNGKQGCELLVPASKLNDSIPGECNRYYAQKCNGTNLQLYRDYCTYN